LAAAAIATKMRRESGVSAAVASFHRHLPRNLMKCDVFPHLPATWTVHKRGQTIKLSAAVAEVLMEKKKIKMRHMKL
jgi:hypothetical protein